MAPLLAAQEPVGSARSVTIALDGRDGARRFLLADERSAAPIYVASSDAETVRMAANAFSEDIGAVTGGHPTLVTALPRAQFVVVVGTIGHSPVIDTLRSEGKLDTRAVEGKWESAVTALVRDPAPGVAEALVIAGSDRRGAAYALFALSREMGVSPWTWWADVPVRKAASVSVTGGMRVQGEPSVRYRGIFLNDEDWGFRPWAAGKMDPGLHNVGPRTYERVFELLLRLRANTLWPAMHPGSLAFNAVKENAVLADRWGIVMSSSHSEALLRNNVGEWDEKRDGPWNYQTNSAAIDRYWDERLKENGKYENFYTVGMRGVHDSGLEATGTAEVKARLVEDVMTAQRKMLRERVNPAIEQIPQVIWLYKESLDLYRAGMRVPEDVTLGWTDDNYGYLRQLSTEMEQKRKGGSAIYYHVSYWGQPHDYLWLCTTPPALIQEEMTKGYEHGARRLWMLNVGDLKPAEMDIDYFMQLAWDEPRVASLSQKSWMEKWFGEQFPAEHAGRIAALMAQYYQLNFVRKPEFMGFNGYNDGVKRTDFNPLGWGDQNLERRGAWERLSAEAEALAQGMSERYRDAFFELVKYPVEAAAAQNAKFLWADRSYLDASGKQASAVAEDARQARRSFDRVQELTAEYAALAGGKWAGMMSSSPRGREVFKMPATASASGGDVALPASWSAGKSFAHGAVAGSPKEGPGREEDGVISMNPTHFSAKSDGSGQWTVLPELGLSGASLVWESRAPVVGPAADSAAAGKDPWVEYNLATVSSGDATLTVVLLPTFPVDPEHRLRYSVSIDGGAPVQRDGSGAGRGVAAPAWATNVLRNGALMKVALPNLAAGRHTVRLIPGDPGVIFEHLVLAFDGAAPAYPFPPPAR